MRGRRLTGALAALSVATATVGGGCGDDGPADDGQVPVASNVAVVAVAAQPCARPNRDRGLGVVVADDLVATAAHTVDGPRRELTVDGRAATVVALDARTDLALLAVPIDGEASPLADGPVDAGIVHTEDEAIPVAIVRTVSLVVDDTTAGRRHERQAHVFTPGVEEGTSGAPLATPDGRVLGIVVLDRRDDDMAYAVTSAELSRLLAGPRRPGPPDGCAD